MRWGERIPLRDGIELSATLYLPREAEPSPAVVTLTPYVAQTYHAQGLYFASHGYPFLVVDVRGRGNSQGVFEPNVNEARDGHDVVEWLARQPYCNGKVAMWGGSYGAISQWAAAKEHPPHLVTIVPAAAVHIGFDFPIRGNLASPYWMQWIALVSGRTSQDEIFFGNEAFWAEQFRQWFESGLPFKGLDNFLGNPSAIFQKWLAHPESDAYWDRCNPSAEDYARLSLPILTITGIYDNAQLGALKHYRQHMQHAQPVAREKHFLVIGPWDHAGTRSPQKRLAGVEFGDASLVDLPGLHLEWYAWTLLGGPKPEFLKKPVTYYVTGAERWRYTDTLEEATAQTRPLYLDSSGNASQIFASGLLRNTSGEGQEDCYVYDPRDISIAQREAASPAPHSLRPVFPLDDLTDQRPVYWREGRQLIYHSAPLESDTEIAGFFRLSVWLAIDQPDTDFQVCIYEIDEAGSSLLLSVDVLRARYREGLCQEKLIDTAAPLRYDFERFTFTSRLMRRGCRIRLTIGPMHSIYQQRNHNSGGVVAEESMQDARTVIVKLFHDEAHPSVLYVPLGQTKG